MEEALKKLKIIVNEANAEIQKTSSKISMPSIANETKKLKLQAVSLKNKMNELEKDISKTETTFSMANLERLDNLKIKLEAAKNYLEQNDSFSKLQNELEDILENEDRDIALACKKLHSLQKSYEAQKGLAGETERGLKLEEFKNRIEANLTGNVIKALTDGNIEDSLKYVEMFKKIDRLSQMKSYYGSLQQESYVRSWIEISTAIENTENSRFLSDFYENFLNNWNKQLKWYRDVLACEGVNESIQVICDTLNSLNPSRESVISSYLKRINEKVELLQDVSHSNVKFANDIRELIQSSNVVVNVEKMASLSHAIFNYFNISIVHYSTLEQTSLDANFDALQIMQSNGSETVRCLESAVTKVFEYIHLLIDRQSLITQDCAIISLIYILNTFFKTKFLEKFKKAQLQLDASRNDQQDWNLLQICISLLENIGIFKMKLDEVEEKIHSLLLAKSKQIEDNELFGYKIFGQRDINEFNKFIKRLKSNELVIFDSVVQTMDSIAKDAHEMLLRNVFAPIEGYFKQLEINDSNSSPALPDFFFPLTYITEIGQFLLTLPQHLEPLLLQPAKPLKIALEASDESYKENAASADILLSIIADETCSVYQLKIRQLNSISDSEAKQLATDIEYLGSVLEELGLTLSSHLKQTVQLLKAKPQNYLAASSGADPKLVTSIRQMRGINITE